MRFLSYLLLSLITLVAMSFLRTSVELKSRCPLFHPNYLSVGASHPDRSVELVRSEGRNSITTISSPPLSVAALCNGKTMPST